MTPKLLNDAQLFWSETVANCTMNREREIVGTNSYSADLGMNPLEILAERLEDRESVAWLDVCCGSGRALIQSGQHFSQLGLGSRVKIQGIDLVSMFVPQPGELSCVRLAESSIQEFAPTEQYDLITCVHGLHYVGDKLGAISRATSWLTGDGLFIAHLDLDNVKLTDSSADQSLLLRELQRASIDFNRRTHIVSCRGRKELEVPFEYQGADDTAGPNFTGQPAVDSYYSPVD